MKLLLTGAQARETLLKGQQITDETLAGWEFYEGKVRGQEAEKLAGQGLRRKKRRPSQASVRCNPILWVEPDCQAFREVFFLRGICAHLSEGWEINGIFVDNRVGIVKQRVNNG